MAEHPSLMTRIAIGKAIGFGVGLIGFLTLPAVYPGADPFLSWGILLWYTTMGGLIGLAGVITWHPLLDIRLPWWVRGPTLGAWLNFVLVFFAHNQMNAVLVSLFGADGVLQSPFWFVAEGALVGLLIGYLATRFGGEGRAALDMG